MITHKPLYQAMISATCQTLENMIFSEAMEHFDCSYKIPADDLIWTSILINDPVQGEIVLAMSKSSLKKMTADIFALDIDAVEEAQTKDIINELLNTIVGLFMTNLVNDDQTYKIGLPELNDGELPEIDANTISWKLMTSDEDAIQIYANGASLVALNDN